jgi:hypothetical protein
MRVRAAGVVAAMVEITVLLRLKELSTPVAVAVAELKISLVLRADQVLLLFAI